MGSSRATEETGHVDRAQGRSDFATREGGPSLGLTLSRGLALLGSKPPPAPTADEYARGVVWMFPGIEGGAWQMDQPARALRDAGVGLAIEVHDWSNPWGQLANLTDLAANRRRAAEVAARIAAYRREFPAAPVHLVGYSGGGGLAILVAEALPDGVVIDNLVLVQAAISPRYDLRPALRHTRGRIVNLHCPTDVLTLALGTTLFGTIDRAHVASAGQRGFELSAVSDPSAGAADDTPSRVIQIAWDAKARRAGHLGGHIDIVGYEWNRRFVAPWCGGGD